MITIKNLSKSWKEFSLKETNLDVKSGEYFVILGPTGAGKTLPLELIAGFEMPDVGRIQIDGNDITELPPDERKIGFVYQHYWLFPHMTVEENVAYGLQFKKLSKNEVEQRSKKIMNLVKVSHLSNRYPQTLSGGEQQKSAIARAIVIEPEVMLLDEPLSALDARTRDLMRGELKRINRELGTTVIHVTHDQTEAMVLGVENVFEGIVTEKADELVLVKVKVKVNDLLISAISRIEKGSSVNVFIRPEDIIISKKPQKTSARNHIRSKIVAVVNLGPVVRIELDNGFITLTTKRSAEELGLSPDKNVYASFKATAVHLVKR